MRTDGSLAAPTAGRRGCARRAGAPIDREACEMSTTSTTGVRVTRATCAVEAKPLPPIWRVSDEQWATIEPILAARRDWRGLIKIYEIRLASVDEYLDGELRSHNSQRRYSRNNSNILFQFITEKNKIEEIFTLYYFKYNIFIFLKKRLHAL